MDRSILSQRWNGRVDVMSGSPSVQAQFAVRNPNLTTTTLTRPLVGIWDDSPMQRAFFSRENTQTLQNALRRAIYEKSKQQYLIGPQDVTELHIVMRSMYLQYARNLPVDIPGQIGELNKMVLNYCVQQVYSECQARAKYLLDVSSLVVPIAHPVQANDTDRELVLHEWF